MENVLWDSQNSHEILDLRLEVEKNGIIFLSKPRLL